jgi:hypothetical protein
VSRCAQFIVALYLLLVVLAAGLWLDSQTPEQKAARAEAAAYTRRCLETGGAWVIPKGQAGVCLQRHNPEKIRSNNKEKVA